MIALFAILIIWQLGVFELHAQSVVDNNLQAGDYIHLQVVSDACNNHLSPFLIVAGDQVVTSEVEGKAFKVTYLEGSRIQLRSEANGYWLAGNYWGNSNIVASKTVPSNPGWETFVFEKIGSGKIRIRTADQSTVYYWSANSVTFHNTAVMANSTTPGNCETFNVYRCKKVYDGYCTESVSNRVWGVIFANNDVINSQWLATKNAELDQVCAAHCHSYPGCTAWVREPSASTNNCYLTHKATGYRAATDRNSGPGANFWHWHAWNPDTAVPTYNNAETMSVTSNNACSNLCASNSACVAWSRDATTNTCRLYQKVADLVSDDTSHCGVRALPVASQFYNHDNSLTSESIVHIQSSNGLWWSVDRSDNLGTVRLLALLNPYDQQQQFVVEKLPDDRILIQNRATSLWFSFSTNNSARFSKRIPGNSEVWQVQRLYGLNREQVQLQTSSTENQRWLTLSDSPDYDVESCLLKPNYPDSCSSVAALATGEPGNSETFNIIRPPDPFARLTPDNSLVSNEYYQIQASNGYWWQVEDDTGIVKLVPGVNPNDDGRWFKIVNLNFQDVQIQSRKTGLWLRAAENGGGNARFGVSVPSSWETYRFEQLSSGSNKQVRLRTNGGTFWITLAYSFFNDVRPCYEQESVDRCTSINAKKAGEPGEWETFNMFSYTALTGTNLGSWFVLEEWMNSEMFVDGEYQGVQLRTSSAHDEWTWSEKQTGYAGRVNAAVARAAHWDNAITDSDFQWMAAHKINAVRIPVGYWLCLTEQQLLDGGYPFLPGGITRLDRVFEVAASYGIWVIISVHGAYGSQNGNDHSGHSGSIDFGTGTTAGDTADFVKFLATRYADKPNFYGIGLLNEPYIWEGNIPVSTLHDYFALSSGHLRTAAPFAMAFISDAFQLDKVQDFLPPFKGFQVLESHPYRAFDSSPGDLQEQMNRIQNDINSIENAGGGANYWTFVGECSNGANNDVWNGMSDSERYYGRRLYGTTQADGYGKHKLNMGYTFWTYKITGESYNWASWSLRQSIEDQTWPDFYVRT